MKKSPLIILIILFIGLQLLFQSGCAPVFSELQSARTVGNGNAEFTPGYSSVSFTEDDGGTQYVQKHIGLQAAYGLAENIDLRLRYEYLWANGEDFKVNVLGFGPKISVLKNRIALYAPVGFAWGEEIGESSETWQFHPTVLFTIPVVDRLDINPSFKMIIPFRKERDNLIAFNLGVGLKLNEKLILRPEYGVLFNPGEEGRFGQFSIGLSIRK